MHFFDAHADGRDAFAIAEEHVQGLHDVGEDGKDLLVESLGFLFIAALHEIVDFLLVIDGVRGRHHTRAAGAEVVRQLEPAAAVEDADRAVEGFDCFLHFEDDAFAFEQ